VDGPRRWDLTALFPDGATAVRTAKELAGEAARLAESATLALADGSGAGFVAELGRLDLALADVQEYARMCQYADAADADVQTTVVAVQEAVIAGQASLARALDAWRALPEGDAEALLDASGLAPAAYRLRRERHLAVHRLAPEAEAAWAARTESARERWASLQEQVEASVRLPFDDGSGLREWGIGDLETVLRRPDAGVRRAAYETLAAAYAGIRDVLAVAWDAAVADRLVEDRLRGRGHPAQETLQLEDMPLEGLRSLLDLAPGRYGLRQELLRRQAELLGLRTVRVADAEAPPPGLPSLSYAEVAELAIEGLGALAPRLGEDARALLASGRVDGETRPGKQRYAVTFATRLQPPAFVAFRYTGAAANVPLLGHELGHAVGLARSAAAQPPIAHGWPGVVFEVPSLVGEIAAGDAFAARYPESAREIRLVAAQSIGWAVFESLAFCLVELDLYEARSGGAVLTGDRIQSAFERRFGELYGSDVAFDATDALVAFGQWAGYGIPSRFYSFQYAVGALVALALLARRDADRERFAVDYVAFLGEGRSASPADQLRRLGLGLGSDALWEEGFDELGRRFALATEPQP
jgi:oligoendopeptidase F